jgi:uroporphyrinogen-III synthase
VLVASQNAARAVVEAGGSRAAIWAVGPATAKLLEAAGFEVRMPDSPRDGAWAAQALLASLATPSRVIVPRAEAGRDEAIDALRAAGHEVVAIAAYRTVVAAADDPAIARGREALIAGAAACCVFAPSQAAALDALVGIRSIATRWVAIGETTAAALRAFGVEVVVAPSPTPEGLVTALGE